MHTWNALNPYNTAPTKNNNNIYIQWPNPLHKQIKLTTTTHCNQTTQRSPFTPPYPYFSEHTHILSQLLSFTPHN